MGQSSVRNHGLNHKNLLNEMLKSIIKCPTCFYNSWTELTSIRFFCPSSVWSNWPSAWIAKEWLSTRRLTSTCPRIGWQNMQHLLISNLLCITHLWCKQFMLPSGYRSKYLVRKLTKKKVEETSSALLHHSDVHSAIYFSPLLSHAFSINSLCIKPILLIKHL